MSYETYSFFAGGAYADGSTPALWSACYSAVMSLTSPDKPRYAD
jgi:hypothetical protein